MELGFVGHVAEVDDFDAAVNNMVNEISYNSPLIIRMNKRAVKMTKGVGFAEAARKANDYFLNSLMKTGDTLEGIASFDEKRKPVWKNK
jgi:cyclohexa-1,5-dienecarbonyl-CoA hydratase